MQVNAKDCPGNQIHVPWMEPKASNGVSTLLCENLTPSRIWTLNKNHLMNFVHHYICNNICHKNHCASSVSLKKKKFREIFFSDKSLQSNHSGTEWCVFSGVLSVKPTGAIGGELGYIKEMMVNLQMAFRGWRAGRD